MAILAEAGIGWESQELEGFRGEAREKKKL